MSNYSEDPTMVRVDFFNISRKWHTTEAVKWTGGWSKNVDIYKAFRKSLRDHFGNEIRLECMDAVCLHPYHENEFPLMMRINF